MAKTGVPFIKFYSKITSTRPVYTYESLEAVARSNPDIRHDKAAQELRYSVRPLEDTITDLYAWFDEAGCL